MIERRRGRSRSCRIPSLAAVALLGIAIGADPPIAVSAAAKEIPAAGANVIANPDFDTGVAGWTPLWFTQSDADAASRGWSAAVKWAPDRDFAQRRTSGSLELAITAAEGRCVWANQCAVVHPGTYELTGKVFIHATNVHTPGAVVNLEVFWEDRCSSPAERLTRWSVDPTTADTGRWTQIAAPATFSLGDDRFDLDFQWFIGLLTQWRAALISVPEGTHGALLQLSACVSGYATSPETVIANFDHLNLRAVSKGNPAPVPDSSRHP